MSKNIVIQKNGVAQSLSNVAKITTGSIEAGSQSWIPEDEANDYADTITLYVTENGEYEKEPETAGYSEVEVEVNPTLTTKYITSNGEYNAEDDQADGYSIVTVDVDPEGTVGSKFITENGTYAASADQLDGYDEVYVSVDTISGDDYVIEDDEDGVYVEYDDIDYMVDPSDDISYILTTDPLDNNQYIISVDEDGTVTKKPYPSGIQIVTPPTKTSYTEGETMDYTGIVVKLVNADGTTYTDARYPNGIIPMGELEFPVSVAPAGGGGTTETPTATFSRAMASSARGYTFSGNTLSQINSVLAAFPNNAASVNVYPENSAYDGSSPISIYIYDGTAGSVVPHTTHSVVRVISTRGKGDAGKPITIQNVSVESPSAERYVFPDGYNGWCSNIGGALPTATIPVRWRSWVATFNPITGQYDITDKRLMFRHAHETSFEIEVTSA